MKTKQKVVFLQKFIKGWKDNSNQGICPSSLPGNLRVEETVTLSSDINRVHTYAVADTCPHTN